jgi:hypothetical protein
MTRSSKGKRLTVARCGRRNEPEAAWSCICEAGRTIDRTRCPSTVTLHEGTA